MMMIVMMIIMMMIVMISSHLYVEAQGQIEVPGTLNSQFIYLVSNVSIVISGIVKSQRSDCITDELCHFPVGDEQNHYKHYQSYYYALLLFLFYDYMIMNISA